MEETEWENREKKIGDTRQAGDHVGKKNVTKVAMVIGLITKVNGLAV